MTLFRIYNETKSNMGVILILIMSQGEAHIITKYKPFKIKALQFSLDLQQ